MLESSLVRATAGYMKSYRILRTLDDDSSWNMLILREYKNLASMEANEEKADELARQLTGDDQTQMRVTKTARKFVKCLAPRLRAN